MKNKPSFTIIFLFVMLIVLTYQPKQVLGQDSLLTQSNFKIFHKKMLCDVFNLREHRIKSMGFETTNMQTLYSTDGEGEHFFGRYIITLMGSVGLWTITVATASLIDNGTPSPPREWFEDNFWLTARPSMILGSTTISMLLFKQKRFKTFISLIAINSAVLTASYFAGKQVSEEADPLLQLTTTFFLVPMISTLYNAAFPEEKITKIRKILINLPRPSIQFLDKAVWIGGRIDFHW